MEKKIASLEKKSEGKVEVELVVEDEEEVLPGFRFHPTDEELVGFYLRRKVDNRPMTIEIIKQIDIYKYDPWDLPKVSTVNGEKEWYFFCLRGRKYRNSIRPNRVTGSGFWKATGIDRPIHSASGSDDCIGLKKSLVYYRGSAGKGTKTDWMMHEFRLPSNNKDNETCSPSLQEAEIWTICRIFKRNVSFKKYTQGWKQQAPKQTVATDSSSQTSSFDSDARDEYKFVGYENNQQNLYFEENNPLFGGQWSLNTSQTPTATSLHPSIVPSPNTNEFLKEGNWDELGRIMEFYMMDQSATQECVYY
ncbi:uncharacterized protein A4U43_C03F6680 [Asparagus officinalis]|uniref:NAC domain-containing protein n=1 Tax=Asparagus officinalis TaxID=4686 RepID=A0A5P1FAN5_ASPOF|nr:transcription factor JUNGBRUNNEN 1-like [Asparagus officinalis]ONK74477.1 uncharacterized protein A4U43_C03F6680 [Asparagus officinalis]